MSNSDSSSQLRFISEVFSYFVILIGFFGLLGWILNVEFLKTPSANFSTIKINAAICFILIGFALCFLQEKRINSRSRRISQILALVVALIGILTLFEHISVINLGIDQLLYKEAPGALNTSSPNRMGLPAAINFVLIGLALIFLDKKIGNDHRPSQYLALIVGFFSILALMGYAYNVPSLYFVGRFTGIAIYAAIAFLFLFLGVLFCRPNEGLMRTFNTDLLGGKITPLILLPTILITLILGWIIVQGMNMGFYPGAFGISLLVISTIIISFILIWLFAIRLNLIDAKIRDTTLKLRDSRNNLEEKVEKRTDELITINQDLLKEIDERKSLQRELKQKMNELSHLNEDLNQFAYVASHDLREPLRNITSFLQLLERRYKDQLDQDANVFIGFAVDGAKRLDELIKDLLEYSRVANKEIQFTDVNFQNVADQVVSNLRVLIEENNAHITYGSLPTIRSDKNQMKLLLQNLLSNAIKYRSKKTPQIQITAKKEANQYVISVKDNGIGIDHKHLNRIFGIFNRLHTQEEYEGSGIGLAIAQRIVHQHGGEIWAESQPGKGSTFYFTIPETNT